MGDFFLDDQFPEHPKALFVGDAACWLYTCGLAWANKHNTGLIPKSVVCCLTGFKNNAALAKKLASVAPGETNPLWHDEGDYYRIHDWHVRNAKKIIKREQSQRAAHAKWEKFYAQRDANASASAEVSQRFGQSGTAADALPYQPENQRTKEPERFAIADTEGSSPQTVGEDAGIELGNVTEALRKLARRDLEARNQECPNAEPVRSEFSWMLKAMQRRRTEYAHVLGRVSSDCPVETIIEEVDAAQPERTRKANWACSCEGTWMVETDTGWAFCPDCHPRGRRSA